MILCASTQVDLTDRGWEKHWKLLKQEKGFILTILFGKFKNKRNLIKQEKLLSSRYERCP